jgi:hypothetical protein
MVGGLPVVQAGIGGRMAMPTTYEGPALEAATRVDLALVREYVDRRVESIEHQIQRVDERASKAHERITNETLEWSKLIRTDGLFVLVLFAFVAYVILLAAIAGTGNGGS